ncbi:MAG: nitronate monooxygenase [Candidatus Paracaedibacteraceae bacterium]|nr:nitronate monooxygenase [Candidatus Paracaedibacteraceae bacterium]
MTILTPKFMSGKEVFPLVEGGKGIAVSTGQSAGAWAAAGGVGTFSAVNADAYDAEGNFIPVVYNGRTRRERHHELISYAIKGGISQAKVAHEMSNGNGRIHMNVLWEMGAVEPILHGILSQVKGLVHGVTCGAGMPYKLAEICSHYNVFYYPIVSSARAFSILWKRAYSRFTEYLGGIVYEDPWLAGGHNGLSNVEDPKVPQPPYQRVKDLRKAMTEVGLAATPIIMAGGVWWLSEWQNWIDNPEIGPIAFQFGTRPLLTQESTISPQWKQKLMTLKEGDIYLNKFSPTGFYSSAVENSFLRDLKARSERQIPFTTDAVGDHTEELPIGARGRLVYVTSHDKENALTWIAQGFNQAMRTPDSTLVFVTPESEQTILKDQIDCMGCLSSCNFSNWAQNEAGTNGRKADPRSFCIQKTLQSVSHGGDPEHELLFSGHQAYRFKTDPFYAEGFIPTVKQLVARILTGY